ncbi:ATP-binding protein [Aetokthonos hydrillicola Thurmond2011]|jgi:SpoVK/Ycf46/Vps4 family AAA+-type ATPase|uniref:ATP-binding protein n=1 Tax=Aetokthonos hydrillicola Thurmond2011 TaxID=2712845 RepID=A0AAP5M9T0_9CYAN|nr:ATP-binding protein [Aetokthonos hydrillicola]MBO3457564.1 ATP-binding protein [Aetokthonos hydrillicola CCALA 1050]MBW4590898.1 ATP-binding protein [Aetokthonos hydrillicola CCALA 1050]MDR9894754.1 ATP-binding protein [Aetokthonos hydrillicola Thurmond2011]
MNTTDVQHWQRANQNYLMAALAIVCAELQAYCDRLHGEITEREKSQALQHNLQTAAQQLIAPSALENLCAAFGLSSFERDVLLLCAGIELDGEFARLCRIVSFDTSSTHATFSLAMAALPEAHWSALLPESPLRYWRLLEVSAGNVMAYSPLRIDERILHYLTGMSYLDDRLQGLVEPVAAGGELPPSHQILADRMIQLWQQRIGTGSAIQLCGDEDGGKEAIASAVCNQLGIRLWMLRGADIPVTVAEREALIRLWEREAILSNTALLLDCQHLDSAETTRAIRFIERMRGLLIVVTREPLRTHRRSLLRFNVNKPSPSEQKLLWQNALGNWAADINGQIEPLVMQFNLSTQGIQAACLELQTQESEKAPINTLWKACRAQARTRLDDLAQRIEPVATWDDLVLPELQHQILKQIAAHVKQRAKVYETWGFASKSASGLGISALFAGMSGTGKTMAAEVLAHQLQLDLYRIDLSSVVSKYIGETEKNLRRVFDAAEAGGAILLFDEADALFGKRSEVKDSHDRYANIEVSYLLQRMEAYRGLAILTTNLKGALDTAFLRRLRFIVQFPFPDAAQRTEIWRRIFPSDTPTEGLDMMKLGRLNVAGGNIRNIALNAAFLAADAGEAVQMKHLLAAAQSEYSKLEKSLIEAEIGGWV